MLLNEKIADAVLVYSFQVVYNGKSRKRMAYGRVFLILITTF